MYIVLLFTEYSTLESFANRAFLDSSMIAILILRNRQTVDTTGQLYALSQTMVNGHSKEPGSHPLAMRLSLILFLIAYR